MTLRAAGPESRRLALAASILALALTGTARANDDASRRPTDGRAATSPIEWDRVAEEAATLLSRYIQIDTTNPPGRETAAANFLAEVLRAEGFEPETVESVPGRANVYARRRGRRAGAVVLLNHLDVVPASPEDWTVAPFAGTRRDGYVWGRGALDCKGPAIAQLMALVLLARRGETLAHDVVFLGTADEETGGALGAGWIARNRRKWLAGAKLVINEGDYIHADGNGRPVVHVAVAEKAPCWLRLTARGSAGHGSTPPAETAVTRLVAALDRIRQFRPAVRVVPTVAAYYAALATIEGSPDPSVPDGNLAKALDDPSFRAEFESDPKRSALIRDTITPTVLVGSAKTNVIPAIASAELDCRLLPGGEPSTFIEAVRRVVDDPTIEISPILSFAASASPAEGEFMRAVGRIATAELDGAAVVPSMLAGFTDSHYFRDLGIPSYGFVPFVQPADERRRIHGSDERLRVEVLGNAIRFLYLLLHELGE